MHSGDAGSSVRFQYIVCFVIDRIRHGVRITLETSVHNGIVECFRARDMPDSHSYIARQLFPCSIVIVCAARLECSRRAKLLLARLPMRTSKALDFIEVVSLQVLLEKIE